MLDIAQLRAGKFTPHLEVYNLKDLFEECL